MGKTIPRIDPYRSQTKTTTWGWIPGISLNPALTKAETNKSITTITPIVSQTRTDALKKGQGIKFNTSTTNTGTFRNISGITPDQVNPDQPKVSAKTSTTAQPQGNGRPASGKPTVSNKSLSTVFLYTETFSCALYFTQGDF